MKHLIFPLILVTTAVTLPSVTPIAIRHDVPDSLYVDLGLRYSSVVRVGERGGDGTLIAPGWVLTAAHIAEGLSRREDFSFRVFVDHQEEGYVVDQVILHPEFTHMGPHDVALLHLEQPVQGVEPVGLYRDRDERAQTIILVGHGDTKPGTGGDWVVDGHRRGATNVVDETTDSHIIFDFDEPSSATALEGTAGPGDSGGPAFIEVEGIPYIAGISSLGQPGKDGPGTYGAVEHYVRVSSHVTWIESVISDPPSGRYVNMPQQETRPRVRRVGPGGPGALPPGVILLEEIGLLVASRDGQVRMVGRIDQRFPDVLLEAGIRPPAVVMSINGKPVTSPENLKILYDSVKQGAHFILEFEHRGQVQRFELVK